MGVPTDRFGQPSKGPFSFFDVKAIRLT
jgi:hypothetical protein